MNEIKRRFEEWRFGHDEWYLHHNNSLLNFLDSFEGMKLVPEGEQRWLDPKFITHDEVGQVVILDKTRFEQLEKRLGALEADVKALNNIVNEMSETEEIKKRI